MALSGCNLIPGHNTPPPPKDENCGADVVAEQFLNSRPTAEVKAYIAARVGDRPIRYYRIGDPVTMDYNPGRLNVELGKSGRISNFRCG